MCQGFFFSASLGHFTLNFKQEPFRKSTVHSFISNPDFKLRLFERMMVMKRGSHVQLPLRTNCNNFIDPLTFNHKLFG